MNRSIAIGLLLLLLPSVDEAQGTRPRPRTKPPLAAPAAAPAPPPNVVLIVADDLGYADLTAQGTSDIPTPNIDRIFHEGVRFTDGYMTASLCSPSRAGLITGRYQTRFGHDFNPGEAGTDEATFGLPADMPTIAELLKARGYATALIGKWHLGSSLPARPTRHGFDEFFGFLGREHWYMRNKQTSEFEPLWHNEREVQDTTYLTRALAREAVSFIERHRERPFLLYLPFNAVHVPMQDDPATASRVAGIADHRRQVYASMLLSMDDAVGQLLGTLDRLKLAERTLVFFVSDNGGPTERTTARNTPLRGKKAELFEGGVRVPFALRWPGKIAPGTVYRQPVSALDVTPTALIAAGATVAPNAFDGVDLLPFINGARGNLPPHERLYWRQGYKWAVREGRWKVVQTKMFGRGTLYDLEADIGEQQRVKGQREIIDRLNRDFEAWNDTMAPPRDQLPGILGKLQQLWRSRGFVD